MDLSHQSLEPSLDQSKEAPQASSPSDPMWEYYQLKHELLITTLGLSGLIFGCVWFFYSLDIALNYLIGACTGVVYLRMLAKNVEQLGTQKKSLGSSQLALVAGLMIVATQWNQLQVVPIFLGFLTYKAAVIIYTLRTTLPH